MSVADALAAPSLEMAAVHPALSVVAGKSSRSVDWSVNRLVLTRTAVVVVCAWSIGRVGFSVLWVTAFSLLLVFSIVRQRKRAQFFHTLKFQKAMHDPVALQRSLPLVPPWISFPDLERADFIQTICSQMWPVLKQATEAAVLQFVPPIMDRLKPPPLTALSIIKLDLGNVPPSIPGVRLQSQSSEEGEIMLDVEVEFAGNPAIVVEAKSGPAFVHVNIADFFFRSTVRAVLKPLLYEIPCFGAVAVSFVSRPEINFKLSTVGVSVMSIPGLNELLYDLIKTQLAAFVLWPKKIIVPIKKLSAEVMEALNTAECQGVLRVRVRGAKDIRPGDTYCKLSVGGQKKKTEARKHTAGSVEWKDEFDFLIHDADNDELLLELKSKENALLNTVNTLVINHIKSSRSTALGDISLPVNRFTSDRQANAPQELWLPLHHQHKGRTGQLHVEITWSPFRRSEEEAAAAAAGDARPDLLRRRSTKSRLSTGPPSGSGLLIVNVHSAAGLKKPSGHATHGPYVVLTLGDHVVKTNHGHGGSNEVKWEQQFEMSVTDWATATLRLEVRDRQSHLSLSLGMGKDVSLGELLIPLVRVQKEGRKTETLPLQKTQSGTITISTELKEM